MPEERVSIFIIAREAAGRVFRAVTEEVRRSQTAITGLAARGGAALSSFARHVQARLARVRAAFSRLRSTVGALGLTLGGLTLGLAARKLFELGTAAEETRSKFLTVFQGMQAAAGAFVDDFGRRAGQTRQEAEELIATTGAIAQGFGFQSEEAFRLTQAVANLGADFASFHNLQGGTADGIDIINRGLAGQYERLQAAGIILRAVEVDQRALNNTGKRTVDALTEQERVTARMQLITEKAGVAVGDLARTYDSTMNRARRTFAQLRQIGETFGTIFVEIIGGGFAGADERLARFNESLERNRSRIIAWARVVLQSIDLAIKAFVALFRIAFELGNVFGRYMEAGFSFAVGGLVRLVQRVGEELLRAINNFVIKPANAAIRTINIALPQQWEIGEIGLLDEQIQSLDRVSKMFFENGRRQSAGLVGDLRQIVGVVGNLVDEWNDVREAAGQAQVAQEQASRAITGLADVRRPSIGELARPRAEELVAGLVPSVVPITRPLKLDLGELGEFKREDLLALKESFLAPFLDLAKDFVARTRPELEELQDIQLALRVAFDAGKITSDEFRRSMDALDEAMKKAREGTTETALSFQTLAPLLANAIAQIIQGLRGGGGGFFGWLGKGLGIAAGVLGTLATGGVGGVALPWIAAGLGAGSILAGSLASRGGQEIPVSVGSYGQRALDQMKEATGPEKVIVQVISPTTGEILDETLYEIDRRSRIDQVVRIPRSIGS